MGKKSKIPTYMHGSTPCYTVQLELQSGLDLEKVQFQTEKEHLLPGTFVNTDTTFNAHNVKEL